MAKSLIANNSKIIALILPTIHHPLFSKFAYHVEQVLNANGYKLLICNSNFEVEKELEYIKLLNKKVIGGIIFITNSNINDYLSENLPIVTIDRHLSNEMIYISSDNYAGGRQAAKHLLSKGCSNLGFLGGFPNVETEVHKRKQGFNDFLTDKNIPYTSFEEEDVIEDFDKYIEQFWNKHSSLDGVFAVTDILAYKLINYLHSIGKKVPEDVKVVGYDGIDLFDISQTKLTTIVQPIDIMGEAAAESVMNIVEKKKVKHKYILPVELRQGEST
nr:substrate-binding domain-containing protein [Acidaminobacter sp. JC074]